MNVMLVDDNESDAALIEATLKASERIKAELVVAGSLTEAAEASQNELFDVIICDLNLPDVSGPDTVRRAKGVFPAVPLVVVSGALDHEMESHLFGLGVQDCLSKTLLSSPVASDILARVLIAARDHHALEFFQTQTLQSLNNVLEASNDGMLVVHRTGEVAAASTGASELLSVADGELEGSTFKYAINTREPYEVRVPDGGAQQVLTVVSTPISWLGQPAFLVALHDTTEQAMREERLLFEATHDLDTGLVSRVQFLDRLSDLMAGVKGRHELAVLLVQLEHLDSVNRSFGHRVGDGLVKVMASRFVGALPGGCAVGRPGVGQFAAAVPSDRCGNPADLMKLAERTLETLSSPVVINDEEVPCTVTLSVAWHDGRCGDPRELLERAEMATAPRDGSSPDGLCIYEPPRLAEKLLPEIRRDLGAAIAEGDLTVAYQPILDATTGNAVGL